MGIPGRRRSGTCWLEVEGEPREWAGREEVSGPHSGSGILRLSEVSALARGGPCWKVGLGALTLDLVTAWTVGGPFKRGLGVGPRAASLGDFPGRCSKGSGEMGSRWEVRRRGF